MYAHIADSHEKLSRAFVLFNTTCIPQGNIYQDDTEQSNCDFIFLIHNGKCCASCVSLLVIRTLAHDFPWVISMFWDCQGWS